MTNPKDTAINKFVILGGGTAGWLAAATISKAYQGSEVEVELVESQEIGHIGVGEATIPHLLTILEGLGIDLVDFIKSTRSTFKWGIKFEDWRAIGEGYFHPFGELGRPIDGHDFYQCWLKLRAQGDATPLMAHSPEAVLAEQGKFFLPFEAKNSPLARAQYALHLDSTLVGQYLRKYSQQLGVKRTEGIFEHVVKEENGHIARLVLKSGACVEGDFFIDCSGFRGLLIGEALNNGYEDWRHFLPCNRAVTVQTKGGQEILPFTIAKAQSAGWTWRIPLQNRVGNGYVYSSEYSSDEEAKQILLKQVEGELLTEPKVIPFKTGIRHRVWDKNCLALGLAQGFLEPLESTAIHLVSKSIAYFLRMMPDKNLDSIVVDEFNYRIRTDYEEIRDFLVLHYCLTERQDTAFWRHCRTMDLPESLSQKMAYFKVAGGLRPNREALFQDTSWLAIYDGMGVSPKRYNPLLDAVNSEQLKTSVKNGQEAIQQAAQRQPLHRDFIENYCDARY